MALTDFCQRLSSSSDCSGEPLALVHQTRREAQLLMSLMVSNVKSQAEIDETGGSDHVPSSSDHSYTSDCSSASSTRDVFTFTCPSLSLENPSAGSSHLPGNVYASSSNRFLMKSDSPTPAHLLGRPLKVDDRDALRLSADAMVRNFLQSFQKAMIWRIRAWVYSLSEHLVSQERRMLESGACIEEIKSLLETPEAALVVAFRMLDEEHRISVESATTSFEVLAYRAQEKKDEEFPEHASGNIPSPGGSGDADEPEESSISDDFPSTSSESERDELNYYSYTMAHQLRFSCAVQLQTPAGFSEITIEVPGTIEGKFQSSELDPTALLKSVTVDLDTNILASMVEKACRAIVRASIEVAFVSPLEVDGDEMPAEVPAGTCSSARELPVTLSSPPINMHHPSDAVFVTPRDLFGCTDSSSSSKVLLPMPEDLDEKTDKPRRISPQPSPQSMVSPSVSSDVYALAPRSTKRSSPTINARNNTYTNVKRRVSLISPLARQETRKCHDVPDNGPFLPMLVEAACRAMQFD